MHVFKVFIFCVCVRFHCEVLLINLLNGINTNTESNNDDDDGNGNDVDGGKRVKQSIAV